MVSRAQARRVVDAVFPAFSKWDHVVDCTVGLSVTRHEMWVIAAWHLAPMSGAQAGRDGGSVRPGRGGANRAGAS